MRTRSERRTDNLILILLIFALLFTALSFRNMKIENIYPPIFSKKYPLSTPLSFIASSFGMRRLAADIIWIQTLQYYGSSTESSIMELQKHSGDQETVKKMYPQLQKYWQQLMRIDPLFANVHLIGPTVLAWNLKRYDEAMLLIDESIKTLESIQNGGSIAGLETIDEKHPMLLGKYPFFEELKWKLYTLKSVLIYFHHDKFAKAVPLLEKIAFQPDTPIEIKIMLAQVYEKQSQIKRAILLWADIYKYAKKEDRKISAIENIERLKKLTGAS